ncbi:MAG: hypothetical protein A3E84_05660 [Gammaproteobacteria bacterium RIFCSPHIGHO2_12_FULL_42_13]|nr:MAG: hypothetical protein A3E84_05660 [Gammaproteobacteria bacterium RIFCSPHIGHO2_12_FULL_42_13]
MFNTADLSEREQIEALGRWWSQYGKYLLIAVLIGAALGFAWKYLKNMRVQYLENASMIYQDVLSGSKNAEKAADLLKKKFFKTPYASMAALILAKNDVEHHQLSEALTELQWVVDHSRLSRLTQIAHLNAARILLSEGKTNEASLQVKTIVDESYAPLVEWVRGDIASKQGDTQTAQAAYEKAKSGLADFSPATTILAQLSAS